MINPEELLKPVSEEKPCGEDLSYDPGFQELETLLKGKPETQFSEAEPPDWKKVRDRCVELFGRSKDLRLVTTLAASVLKTDGLPDFRSTLLVLKGMLERYWDSFYPLLDPEDNNDPTERVNVIAGLATPKGTFGDPLRLLDLLNEAPLTNSAQMGRFGMADVARAGGEGGGTGPSTTEIEAAFRDTSQETLDTIYQAANQAAGLVEEIDDLLTAKVGASHATDLSGLVNQLKQIANLIAPYVGAESSGEAGAEEEAGGAEAAAGGAPSKGITGEVQSRQDVSRMLDKICDFYKRTEPSSPVPLLLRRAQRLSQMDFMEIIQDMSPNAVGQIQTISGEKSGGGSHDDDD